MLGMFTRSTPKRSGIERHMKVADRQQKNRQTLESMKWSTAWTGLQEWPQLHVHQSLSSDDYAYPKNHSLKWQLVCCVFNREHPEVIYIFQTISVQLSRLYSVFRISEVQVEVIVVCASKHRGVQVTFQSCIRETCGSGPCRCTG
jgi:hypothetical protein